MSVREEDKQKNCPSRGLGLAAAAIGVGVGAALYYYFSKRPENPDSEGSTSQGWNCERPQTLSNGDSEADYTTITECTTSDTSIDDDFPPGFVTCSDSVHFTSQSDDEVITDDDSFNVNFTNDDSINVNFTNDDSINVNFTNDDSVNVSSVVDLTEVSSESDDNTIDSLSNTVDSFNNTVDSFSNTVDSFNNTVDSFSNSVDNSFNEASFSERESGSEVENDWDVTETSMDVPDDLRPSLRDMLLRMVGVVSPRQSDTKEAQEEERLRKLRERAFRERSWSLEECSICFDIMLKDQELMQLPCTHNYHVACIGPWLQEHQTCPMCRKAAE